MYCAILTMAMTRKQKAVVKESRAEIMRLNGIIATMQQSINHILVPMTMMLQRELSLLQC